MVALGILRDTGQSFTQLHVYDGTRPPMVRLFALPDETCNTCSRPMHLSADWTRVDPTWPPRASRCRRRSSVLLPLVSCPMKPTCTNDDRQFLRHPVSSLSSYLFKRGCRPVSATKNHLPRNKSYFVCLQWHHAQVYAVELVRACLIYCYCYKVRLLYSVPVLPLSLCSNPASTESHPC